MSIRNTIIAGNNTTISSDSPDVFGAVTSQGHNLIGTTDGSSGWVGTDLTGTIAVPLDALLAPLGNYGGPTQTHALLPGSPAINEGDNCVLTVNGCGDNNPAILTDQRGIGFNRQVGGTVDIGAVEVNYALAATGGTPQSAIVNTAFANPLLATLTESGQPISGIAVTFTAPGSGASASFTGNPATTNANGQASVIATANNVTGSYQASANLSGLNPVTFNLTNTCQTITVTNPATNSGTANAAFSQNFGQSGGIGTTTFTTASALPTGLTLSTGGVLAGTPTQTGTFPITVKATDSNGCMGTGTTYTLTINCQTISVTNPATNTGTANSMFSQTFTQSGGIGTTTFTTASALPTGLTLSSGGVLAGTPTQIGSFPITVKATDSNGCMGTGATYTLTINCQTITVGPSTIASGTNGSPYSQQFTQTGGIGTTTFSTVSTLPTGITLSSGGLLSGTTNQTGSFPITIKATDSNGCMGTASYNLQVVRLNGSISDPLACTGPGGLATGTIQISNPAASAQAFTLTTTFTNYAGISGSCVLTGAAAGATCTVTTGGLTASGNILANTTLTVSYQAQVATVPTGTILTASNVATLGGSTLQPNPLVFSATVNCPSPGPGQVFPATSEASDQSAGSVLIYNVFTSGATSGNTQNTRINITNTHAKLPAFVHLFFVAEGCSVADSYLCLTANQTASFLASDLDPGTSGYLVAVAVDGIRGCPTNFNYLIGDEYVKFSTGHAANLGAESFSAIPGGLPACDGNSVTAQLNFDGVAYNRLPAALALSNVGSRADGNDTLLIVNRIGGNLGIGASTLGTLFGILYDDAENALSFSVSGNCQLRNSITNNFPRTTPRFESFIPAGRTGWLKLFSQTGTVGMTGAAINFNANAASSAGAFNQGHNLHRLTLSGAASYVIPVFPPAC